MSDFFEKYLRTYRPSGYEKESADFFVKEMEKIIPDYEYSETYIDKMWNCYVAIGSDREDATKILISGHSDQNCLMVSDITNNGFIKYITMGGISPKAVIDSDLFVLTDDGKQIPCFCSYKAIHLEKSDERKKCPEHKDLVIDLGCTSKKEVEELGIKIGDLIVFDNSRLNMDFGKDNKFIVGSGLDDGIACGIVYDVLSQVDVSLLNEHNIRLYGACISSEETGARGAGCIGRKVQPDISIDIDVCHDSIKEVGTDEISDVSMGKGVVIKFGADTNRTLSKQLLDVASRRDIKTQVMAGKTGGTDTNPIQMSNGCETALLSIPCRYMHSGTHEMVHKDDIEGCTKLIIDYINESRGNN